MPIDVDSPGSPSVIGTASPQYKDKKEAIEAFKELLREKVYISMCSVQGFTLQ